MCGFLYRRIVELEEQSSPEMVRPRKRAAKHQFSLGLSHGPLPAGFGNRPAKMKRKVEDDIGLFRKVRIVSKSGLAENAIATTHRCKCYRSQDNLWFDEGRGTCIITHVVRCPQLLEVRSSVLTKLRRIIPDFWWQWMKAIPKEKSLGLASSVS